VGEKGSNIRAANDSNRHLPGRGHHPHASGRCRLTTVLRLMWLSGRATRRQAAVALGLFAELLHRHRRLHRGLGMPAPSRILTGGSCLRRAAANRQRVWAWGQITVSSQADMDFSMAGVNSLPETPLGSLCRCRTRLSRMCEVIGPRVVMRGSPPRISVVQSPGQQKKGQLWQALEDWAGRSRPLGRKAPSALHTAVGTRAGGLEVLSAPGVTVRCLQPSRVWARCGRSPRLAASKPAAIGGLRMCTTPPAVAAVGGWMAAAPSAGSAPGPPAPSRSLVGYSSRQPQRSSTRPHCRPSQRSGQKLVAAEVRPIAEDRREAPVGEGTSGALRPQFGRPTYTQAHVRHPAWRPSGGCSKGTFSSLVESGQHRSRRPRNSSPVNQGGRPLPIALQPPALVPFTAQSDRARGHELRRPADASRPRKGVARPSQEWVCSGPV